MRNSTYLYEPHQYVELDFLVNALPHSVEVIIINNKNNYFVPWDTKKISLDFPHTYKYLKIKKYINELQLQKILLVSACSP